MHPLAGMYVNSKLGPDVQPGQLESSILQQVSVEGGGEGTEI